MGEAGEDCGRVYSACPLGGAQLMNAVTAYLPWDNTTQATQLTKCILIFMTIVMYEWIYKANKSKWFLMKFKYLMQIDLKERNWYYFYNVRVKYILTQK